MKAILKPITKQDIKLIKSLHLHEIENKKEMVNNLIIKLKNALHENKIKSDLKHEEKHRTFHFLYQSDPNIKLYVNNCNLTVELPRSRNFKTIKIFQPLQLKDEIVSVSVRNTNAEFETKFVVNELEYIKKHLDYLIKQRNIENLVWNKIIKCENEFKDHKSGRLYYSEAYKIGAGTRSTLAFIQNKKNNTVKICNCYVIAKGNDDLWNIFYDYDSTIVSKFGNLIDKFNQSKNVNINNIINIISNLSLPIEEGEFQAVHKKTKKKKIYWDHITSLEEKNDLFYESCKNMPNITVGLNGNPMGEINNEIPNANDFINLMNNIISQLKIAFHVYSFSFRGSESCLYDYSDKNETLLNNKSIIVCPKKFDERNNINVIMKFINRFQVFLYNDYEELVHFLKQEKVNGLYIIKYGNKDELTNYFEENKINIPLLIHSVYKMDEPHGTIYAGVSEEVVKNTKYDFVPHMITINEGNCKTINFREQLKIPKGAIIFGRHGGLDTFSLPSFNNPSLVETLLKILNDNSNVYFAFMPRPYILNNIDHPRILYFDIHIDPLVKRSFINMCDSMIHCCWMGESFGISILEFSAMNKPVITWNGGTITQHLRNLENKGILYNNMNELYNIIINFNNFKKKDDNEWNIALPKYSDENVMKKFNQVFLEPLRDLSASCDG